MKGYLLGKTIISLAQRLGIKEAEFSLKPNHVEESEIKRDIMLLRKKDIYGMDKATILTYIGHDMIKNKATMADIYKKKL